MFRRYLTALILRIGRLFPIQIKDAEATVQHILDTHCSLARYGDGEFRLMYSSKQGIGFQKNVPELGKKLWKVILSDSENINLAIGMPRLIYHPEGIPQKAMAFWRDEIANFFAYILPRISRKRIYCDTNATRIYTAFGKEYAERVFPLWKQVWEGRPLLIVEGEKSRLGVGNDMLDNASSIRRILVPATEAFGVYDAILKSTLKHHKEGELVLLAIGPTATVLAYDLAKRGIWTLDLGHLDIQYCLCQDGQEQHMRPVPGKFVNEAGGFVEGELEGFDAYQASVVDIIAQPSPES